MTAREAARLTTGRGLGTVVAAVGRPHLLAVLLLAGALLLIAANAALGLSHFLTGERQVGALARAIDFRVERNLPTVFGSALLLLASLLLARVASRRLLAAGHARRDIGYWVVLAAGFAYLAVDEVARLHDRLLPPLVDGMPIPDALRDEWVIPALAMVVLVGAAFGPFLRRLPTTTRVLFALAGLVYVGGAIGGEFVGALVYEFAGSGALSGSTVLAEEGLELLGIVLFIHALLSMPRTAAPGSP